MGAICVALSRMKLIALHESKSMILLTQHSKQMCLYNRFRFYVHTEIDATVKCKTCDIQNKSKTNSVPFSLSRATNHFNQGVKYLNTNTHFCGNRSISNSVFAFVVFFILGQKQ